MESEFQIIGGAEERPLVILRGVIDGWNAPRAQEAIRRAACPGRGGVCIDVGGLACIDGCGLRALVAEALDLRRAGDRLWLRHACEPLRHRLRLNGFLDLFRLETAGETGRARPQGAIRIVWKEERFRTAACVGCLPQIRHRIVQFHEALGLAGEPLDSIHLAAGEAATNAIRHGSGEDPDREIEVRCAASDVQSVVEIRDSGPGFDPADVPAPEPEGLRPGGMGILIMRSTMDEVTFDFGHGGTVVRLVKRLARPNGTGVHRGHGGEYLC